MSPIDSLYNRFRRFEPFDESQWCELCKARADAAYAADGSMPNDLCPECYEKLCAWVRATLPLVNAKPN